MSLATVCLTEKTTKHGMETVDDQINLENEPSDTPSKRFTFMFTN